MQPQQCWQASGWQPQSTAHTDKSVKTAHQHTPRVCGTFCPPGGGHHQQPHHSYITEMAQSHSTAIPAGCTPTTTLLQLTHPLGPLHLPLPPSAHTWSSPLPLTQHFLSTPPLPPTQHSSSSPTHPPLSCSLLLLLDSLFTCPPLLQCHKTRHTNYSMHSVHNSMYYLLSWQLQSLPHLAVLIHTLCHILHLLTQ